MYIVVRHITRVQPRQINLSTGITDSTDNLLIFTTYHSLHRIQESLDIEVDAIYFDEAHNSVQKNFSLLLNTSHTMRKDVSFLLQLQRIV